MGYTIFDTQAEAESFVSRIGARYCTYGKISENGGSLNDTRWYVSYNCLPR